MLLISTFVVAITSALCPLVNLEVYVAGVGALSKNVGIGPVSFVAAAGQTLGKLIWFQVGRSSMHWPWIARTMQTPKWQRALALAQARVAQRGWVGLALLLLSATVGLPPLAIMAVVCGQLHFNRTAFATMVFVGRITRFAAVLGGSAWLVGR